MSGCSERTLRVSVDVRLIEKRTDRTLMEVNWLRNPFGLSRWLEANIEDGGKLYALMDDAPSDAPEETRRTIAQTATDIYRKVRELDSGVFEMNLDWSWMMPRAEPCLWSIADENPWLWDEIKIVSVTPKKNPHHGLFPTYKDAENDTLVRVPQDSFVQALPEGSVHARMFSRMTTADYKLWTEEFVRIALGFTDPHTILSISK